MVSASCNVVALTIPTYVLSLRPASAADWFIKGRLMCYHVYVINYVKDPQISVEEQGIVSRQQATCAEWGR